MKKRWVKVFSDKYSINSLNLSINNFLANSSLEIVGISVFESHGGTYYAEVILEQDLGEGFN